MPTGSSTPLLPNPARSPSRPHSSTPLVEWMVRYGSGDDEMFVPLYRAVVPLVRGHIRSLVGADPQIEDLVQETFLKAHAGRARFRRSKVRDDRGVVAWYCTIARHTVISELRRRSGFCAAIRGVGWVEGEPSERADMEEAALARERETRLQEMVRTSLGRLPDAQRCVVQLHKMDGLSLRDVAERLGLRPGTARVRAHRAYRGLADRLREQEGLAEWFRPASSAARLRCTG